MPVLGGVDATRAIRRLGCAVPILAMTANASERDREECRAAGMVREQGGSGVRAAPTAPALNTHPPTHPPRRCTCTSSCGCGCGCPHTCLGVGRPCVALRPPPSPPALTPHQDGFLAKPVLKDQLAEALRAVLDPAGPAAWGDQL